MPEHLPAKLKEEAQRESAHEAEAEPIEKLRVKKGSVERQRIIEALERCQGNQTQAAELLGISRRTLIGRLEEYNLPRPRKK